MTRRSLEAAALFGSVACLVSVTTLSAQLSQDEAALVRFIDERSEQSIDLLERLVNINSGSLNLEGVREVGAILDAELAQIGFETRWIDFPASVNRAGHLFAERTGSQGKRLLLIGHLDTVFEEDDAFQTFERRGSVGFGPGTDDMKGGDVVMVLALQALASIGALDDATIRIIFTGDEERPGEPLELVRRDLIEAAKESDAVLGFEGGVRDAQGDWGTIARRGASGWTLRVTGTQAHSSRIFSDEVGAGAIFEAARILNDFYQVVRGEQYLTFNAGMIVGGTEVSYDVDAAAGTAFGKTNVVPRDVVVAGGIRTISQAQLERAQDAMWEVVERHLPHTGASIEFEEGYPAMAPTEGNRSLLDLYNEGSSDLGLGTLQVLDPSMRGAADISFAAPYVDGLAGLGAAGSGAHSPSEQVDLSSIAVQAKRAAVLMYRLTRSAPIS
jgi:glutamate carboxypeptidase